MNSQLLKRMIASYRVRDNSGFIAAVEQVIAAERRQGHERLAKELEVALEGLEDKAAPKTQGEILSLVRELPRGRIDDLPFVEERTSARSLDDIVLDGSTQARVERFLKEYSHRAALAEHGLPPMRRLLFHGPPGNGKTLCAEVIAGELGLPLYYVRFDALIASYLGETAANLRKVFDRATRRAGVLFFDEVDAIARSRDDQSDVGELERVVNSFLQMLDGDTSQGPVIAATNHERSLDEAIWRRFDDVVYFPKPSEEQLERYLRRRFRAIATDALSPKHAAALCSGLCLSDVARITTDAMKTVVLEGHASLSGAIFEAAIANHRAARVLHRS